MTIDQFNDQQFGKGMRVKHLIDLNEGIITGVDFQEKLIEVRFDDTLGEYWCRCENIDIL